MRRIIVVQSLLNLLLLIPMYSFASSEEQSLAQAQLITKAMIREAGLTRLGELLFLADDWHISTVDGFTWQAAAGGLSTFQGQNWVIFVDDRRMDIGAFDYQDLNLLPISIDQVDSVQIFSSPQLHNGEFNERGIVHIHTSAPDSGISLKSRTWIGNETGDPGPYLFIDEASDNVDRSGPDNSFYLDMGFKNWYARLSYVDHNHYLTDPAIRHRNWLRSNSYLRIQTASPALRIGIKDFEGAHELLITHTTTDDLGFLNLQGAAPLFFSPLSEEIPSKRIFNYAGIKGTVPVNPSFDIFYCVKRSSTELAQNPNQRESRNLDWKLTNYAANFESQYHAKNYQGSIGIRWDRYSATTDYELPNKRILLNKIYGKLIFNITPNIGQEISGQLVSFDTRNALKGAIWTRWKISPKQQFALNFSLSERLFAEDNSLWFWSERGYDFLTDNEVDYNFAGPLQNSKQWMANIGWDYEFNDKDALKIGASFRSFENLHLEEQNFLYKPSLRNFRSPITIHTQQEGRVLGTKISATHHPISMLSHRFFYYYQTVVNGDRLFRDVWQAIPQHKFRYIVSFQPVKNFSLWGAVQYLSPTHWSMYKQIEDQTGGQFSADIPGSWIVDLSFQKYLWKRRIRGSLLFRNLFDETQRFHPIGASFNLQYYLQLELLLGGKL